MLAPTHSVFGIFVTLIILALFGVSVSLHWTIIVVAIFGAILPDIDHPKSTIGKTFKFISIPLERKYGHRTITHSIIGWLIASTCFSLIIIPLSFVPAINDVFPKFLMHRWVAAFSISYFSHLLLDMMNKRGSQLLWPDPGRDVIPGNEKFRVRSGSKVELVIFFILLILMIFSFPLSKYGMVSSLRWLLATPESVIQEFKTLKNHTFVEFEGINSQSRESVNGIAEILDVISKRLLILYNGNIYTLSDAYSSDITSIKVRVKHSNKPIQLTYKKFNKASYSELIKQIPIGVLVSGKVDLPKDIVLNIDSNNAKFCTYKTIEQKGNELILSYAQLADIKKISFDPSYDLLQRQDMAEINFLFYKSQKIKDQLQENNLSGDGLTDLGRDLLLTDTEKELLATQKKELENDLHTINLKIEEIQQRIKARQFIFSGEVRIRE